ncbi:hypothetical protein KHQ82_07675 [Mycoplasmatota bacterium]|nr:hypothetical protein KHQ82_07675 [Mycoplasmatota bacterium]
MESTIYQIANIFKSNDYRKIITEYNKLIVDRIDFFDSVIYLFNVDHDINDTYINSFRFIKGRLYEDIVNLESFSNSLFELVYLSKETQELVMPSLYKYKDIFKDIYYDNLEYEQVIAVPFLEGVKVIGVCIFRFKEITEYDKNIVEMFVELLNIKLSALRTNEETILELESLMDILSTEKMISYYIKENIKIDSFSVTEKSIIKGNHLTLQSLERKSLIFELSNKTYRQVFISKNVGYLRDITEEVKTKRNIITDVYYDKESRLYNKNKLLLEIKKKESFSLIKINFNLTYLLDVKKQLIEVFNDNIIAFVNNEIIIYLEEIDKRKLKKIISELDARLFTIATLEYKIGCLIFPKDTKNKEDIFQVLDAITNDKFIFYDKKQFIKTKNENLKKRMIVESIKSNKISLEFYPIIGFNEYVASYYVKHNFKLEVLKDKRLELILLEKIMKRISLLNEKYNFIIDISDVLISNHDMVEFIKSLRIRKCLKERLCFKFDIHNIEFIEYLRKNNIKIARNKGVDKLFTDCYADYMFVECVYTERSNPFLDFLGQLEGREIVKSIFITKSINDYNYLKEQQVGYIITDKFYSEKEL